MNSDDFLMRMERDSLLIDAIASALEAMSLVNGCKVEVNGVAGTLRFESQMLKLHEAMLALAAMADGRMHDGDGDGVGAPVKPAQLRK